MYRPRVLLAEDHAETAERLRKLLRADFDVIASVEDGDALVDAAERLSPDVIVTDIAMAGIDGIAAAVLIRRHDPDARIVFVTVHAESMFVEAGLEVGALGYVLKDSAGEELIAAIRAALDGTRYVSRELGGGNGLSGAQRLNMTRLVFAGIAALFVATGCGQAEAPSPAPVSASAVSTANDVQTRLGALNFERGYPTAETTKKLFDELDYQRAVQAYLWGYPAVSFESIRMAAKEAYGADYLDIAIADRFVDTKSIYLTANDTTIYAFANIDLGKAGPVVVDIPPGAIVGLIDDFWQRSASDVGLPGPHGDKGGKFLLLPPGYTGQAPAQGYEVRQATMNNYNIMVRGIVTNLDSDVPNAVERVRKLRIYPLSEAANPKPNKFASMSGHGNQYASTRGPRVLGTTIRLHQQQPDPGARPVLHGHAQTARHREG